jgi:glycosyltransferase involved in cell wall biosynthesis
MIIGVELRQIVLGQTGGVTQLLKGVLDSATARASGHTFHVFCTVFNRTLLNADRPNVQFHTLPLTSFYADVDVLCVECGVDILFRGYPAESTLAFPLSRTVFQIPDIQHEVFPEFFEAEVLRSRKAAFDQALGHAGAVGTISEYARESLRAYPKTSVDDIFLMPPALQDDHSGDAAAVCSDAELKLIPSTPYFIFPANLWPHKNHERLLEAFDHFRRDLGEPFELVLTGHPAGWDALAAKFPDLPVRHLGFVRPQLLRVLLGRSVALTFFSLHEGFGMPLLEAFNARTAVLCSNTTSLPEVGGDAVLACDPLDVNAMATAMLRLVRSPELRAELIGRGPGRISAYNWDVSAQALLDAFDRVASRAKKPEVVPPVRVPVDGPLVTIVTPSYNQGRFLRRTIESVLTQSYKNIELFVMDGGSTDESVEILKSYGDQIKWVSERDRGQTHAINKGLAQARGTILAYLNSDDVFLPDSIANVVNYFESHSDVSMLYGKAHYIDEDDNITGDYRTAAYSRDALAEECIICQPATFWRRELQDKIGVFDERLHYVMDYDYWLRAANSGAGIVHLEQYLASSRLYADTKTLSARGKIYRELFDICWRHNEYIGRDYFIGYWHHQIYERDGVIARFMRRRPFAHVLLGRLSYVYTSRCKRSPKAFARIILSKLRVRRETSLIGQGNDQIAMPVHAKVRGFYPDNWLMPELRVMNPRQSGGAVGYLQGRSPMAQTVEILADGKVLFTQELRENVEARIELHFPAKPISELCVRFSGHQKDPAKRSLSFALEATNVFGEHDLTL